MKENIENIFHNDYVDVCDSSHEEKSDSEVEKDLLMLASCSDLTSNSQEENFPLVPMLNWTRNNVKVCQVQNNKVLRSKKWRTKTLLGTKAHKGSEESEKMSRLCFFLLLMKSNQLE